MDTVGLSLDPSFVTVVGLAVLALIVLAAAVKIVPQSQTYVVERFGKYQSTLNAGLNLIVPFLDSVAHRIDILERQLPEHPSDVITRDNVLTNVTTSTFYRVKAPEYTVYRIRDIDGAIQQGSELGLTRFRNCVGADSMGWPDFLGARDEPTRRP